jgi:hypothetical protein
MYAVFKVEAGFHLKKCSVYQSVYEATAEAVYQEELGRGDFVVKKIEEKEK